MTEIKFPHPEKKPVRAGLIGQSGTGKSMILERGMEIFQEMENVKVVDIFSSKIEGSFTTIPGGSNYEVWSHPENPDPKSYEGTIYKPVTQDLKPSQPGPVQPFTIPIETLSKESLQALLGDVSRSHRHLFASMLREIRDLEDPNIADLLAEAESLPDKRYVESSSGLKISAPSKRGKKSVQHSLIDLVDHNLVTGEDSELALDLFQELNEEDSRMILETAQIRDRNIARFTVVHTLQRILQLLKEGRIDPYLAIFIREGHQLLNEENGNKGSSQAFRQIIEEFLKESRQMGVSVFIDTQNAEELSQIARSQFNYLFSGRLNNAKSLEKVLSERTRENFSQEDRERLKDLEDHLFYVWTPDGLVKQWKSFPTRSRHREPGETFRQEWMLTDGGMENWSQELKQVREEIQESVEQHNERVEQKLEEQEEEGEDRSPYEYIPGELVRQKRFKREDIEQVLEVQESQARKYAREWKEKGFIHQEKQGREVFYEIA